MVMKGDVKKNLLAIYEIVIEYGGKDYIFYLSNDGNRYSVEALPVDQQRLAQVNITGIITLAIGVGIIALIGGGVCIYLGYNNGKQSEAELNSVQTQLNNLIAIVDYNGLQIDGRLSEVCSPEPIPEKFEAFGWKVLTMDAHDFDSMEKAFEQAKGAMMLVSPTEADTPALYTKEGIDADTTYIVRPAL